MENILTEAKLNAKKDTYKRHIMFITNMLSFRDIMNVQQQHVVRAWSTFIHFYGLRVNNGTLIEIASSTCFVIVVQLDYLRSKSVVLVASSVSDIDIDKSVPRFAASETAVKCEFFATTEKLKCQRIRVINCLYELLDYIKSTLYC